MKTEQQIKDALEKLKQHLILAQTTPHVFVMVGGMISIIEYVLDVSPEDSEEPLAFEAVKCMIEEDFSPQEKLIIELRKKLM